MPDRSVALLYPGDRAARDRSEPTESRFMNLFEAFASAGIHAVPAVYHDDFADEVEAQLLNVALVLVWFNPIQEGRRRDRLDAMLRRVADAGITVSAHPEAILKLGTKDVLFDTREMPFGSDVHRVDSLSQLEAQLPGRLAQGARVLKQHRGHSGIGVWRVERVEGAGGLLRVRHAQRGAAQEQMELSRLLQRLAPYFELANGGHMIDQAWQPRLVEGTVRAYLVGDRVAGFGLQAVNALFPAVTGEEAPQAGPRLYHDADLPQCQELRRLLETQWIEMVRTRVGLPRDRLPLLWDCDFMYGERSDGESERYVLCEINVSSVAPFPPSVVAPLVAAVRGRLSIWPKEENVCMNVFPHGPALRGGLLALAAACLFGLSTPFVQILGKGSGPFTTAALLYAGAALVGALSRQPAAREARLRRGDMPRLLAVAFMGAVVGPVALAWGLQRTSGTSASLMLALEAFFTAVLARHLYREEMDRRIWTAVALLLAGGVALVLGQSQQGGIAFAGLLAVAVATAAWGTDNTLSRTLAERDPGQVVLAKAALGAGGTAILAILMQEAKPSLHAVLGLIVVGATGYGLSLRLYLLAQRAFGAARTGSVFAFAPFIGALGAFGLGERSVNGAVVVGGVLMLTGVVLHLLETHAHEHTHEDLEHEHAHWHDDGHHDHLHEPMPVGPHSHPHRHAPLRHSHAHVPDIHHAHRH